MSADIEYNSTWTFNYTCITPLFMFCTVNLLASECVYVLVGNASVLVQLRNYLCWRSQINHEINKKMLTN